MREKVACVFETGFSGDEPPLDSSMLIPDVRGPAIIARNRRHEHGEIPLCGQIATEPVSRNLHAAQDVVGTAQALRAVPSDHRAPR